MSVNRSHLLNPFGEPPTARQLLDFIRSVRHVAHPRDWQDMTVVMNPDTWYQIQASSDFPRPPEVGPAPSLTPIGPTFDLAPFDRFGGITIHTWSGVPFGCVELTIENAQERALRRLAAKGYTINVVKAEPFSAADWPPPPPAPTVRSLLAHWRKRVRKALTRAKR